MKIEKDKFLIITDGTYSDYAICGLFKTTCEINFDSKLKKSFFNWAESKRSNFSKYFFGNSYVDKDLFIRFLIEKYFIKEIDYQEFNFLDLDE